MKNFDDLEKNDGRFTFEQVVEKVGIEVPAGQLLPGRIYSLVVESPVLDLNEETISQINFGRDYYDLAPIGLNLYTNNFKEISLFLNFKVIPPNVLNKLLEAHRYFCGKNGLANLYDSNKNLIDLKKRNNLDQRLYFTPSKILSDMLGLESLNYAINKYDNELIKSRRLIDWDDIGMLVNLAKSTTGIFPQPANLQRIYENFLQSSINKF